MAWARIARATRYVKHKPRYPRPEGRGAGFTSARGCPGQNLGAASLGQSASWAALAGHTGLVSDTGEQSIWDCILQFNMYDPLALVAAIPKLQHIFDFDTFVVNGVTHPNPNPNPNLSPNPSPDPSPDPNPNPIPNPNPNQA